MLDVECASDRLACIPSLAAEQDRLDPCIMQALNGRSCPCPKAVLQRQKTNEAPAHCDEKYRAPLCLQLRGAGVGDRDADPLLEEKRTTPDDDAIAVRRKCGHTKTGV